MMAARIRMRPGAALGAAMFASLCLAASPALAEESGVLSPRLADLAKPALRTASEAAQAKALSVTRTGPGSLVRVGNRVVVEVRFDHGAVAGIDDLRAAGAQVLGVSRRYQTATVAARPAELPALGGVPGAASARAPLAPVTAAACKGAVTSEGDVQLGTLAAREDFGVDGSGVTVGILSDSFDRDNTAATDEAADVGSGDLPGPGNPCGYTEAVDVLSGQDPLSPSEATDEGRGMAQIVHDLAPGARLAFATAFFNTQIPFAENIERLAQPVAAGGAAANVIVDDVAYFEEPFFQDGPVAVAISKVVGEGASYFTAAGNDNLFEEDPPGSKEFNENEIASWETPEFRDMACPTELKVAAPFMNDDCLDFDSDPAVEAAAEDDTFGITVEEDETLTLDVQWAEPWNGVDADVDVYLLDEAGKPIEQGAGLVGSTENNVGAEGTQIPAEVFSWENTGPEQEVQLVINRCFSTQEEAEEEEGCNPFADPAAKPRIKLILLQNGGGVTATEYPEPSGEDVVGPSIYGHAGAPAAASVAAVHVGVGTAPEEYSSRGPLTHYFGPVEGAEPAPPLEEEVLKPDLAATDCNRTTFFFPTKFPGIFRFCGTSAAAPHAAAVAALIRQANPGLTPEEVLAAMAATAKPVGAFGPEAVGAGLVDAYTALGGTALPPDVRITGPPAALSRNPSPTITFAANRPASFSCSIDGSDLFPCTSPFTPEEPLADGLHGFAVRGEDLAGRVGIAGPVMFEIDTVAPRTFIRSRPRRTIRTRHLRARAKFRFAADEQSVTFACRIDGGLLRFCSERLVRRFRSGRHTVRVLAIDAAGNADQTPAAARFKVKLVGGR
jgi:hypothetical protein